MGDGFLAIFDGPARAIRSATSACEAVRQLGLEIRAGLHTGELEVMDGDIGGIAVNIGDPANTDGSFEAAGVFGNQMTDLLTMEGDYTFHFRAEYRESCRATRELVWSLHVDVGIDPGQTTVTTQVGPSGPGGSKQVTITIVPKDKHGNAVGPGRPDDIDVSGAPGTHVTGPPVDNGDGSYTVPGTWTPGSGSPPGVVIGQPERPPVVVSDPKVKAPGCFSWKLLSFLLLLVVIVLVILLLVT